MALSVKKGSFTSNTGNGNQAVTGVGFQPKAVIFFATNQTATGYAAGMSVALGWAISSTGRYSISNASDDNVTTSNAGYRQSDQTCLVPLSNGTPTNGVLGDFVSMDSDGFTVNWTTNDGTARIIHYMAIGGSDVSNVATGNFLQPTSTGNQAITSLGFRPDLVFFAGMGDAVAGNGAGGRLSFGAASGGSNQGLIYLRELDAQTTMSVSNALMTDSIYYQGDPVAGNARRASFVSLDNSGFTINWSIVDGTATRNLSYLAIQGGRYWVGADSQKTSTGTKANATPGFQPRGVFFMSADATTSSSRNDAQEKISIGGTDGTTQGAIWGSATDNVTTTDTNSATLTSVALRMATNTATTDAEATISSLDLAGYTLNWTTADATAREFVAVVMGDATGVYLRPTSDITVGDWTPTPLYPNIDETTPSDSDWIQGTNLIEVKLT